MKKVIHEILATGTEVENREIYITFFSDLEEQMKKLKPKLNQNAVDIKEKIKKKVLKF